MERKNFDSDFCGSLPLNYTNQIQSYGMLIVVQKSDLKIVQVSANVAGILNIALDDIIGTGIDKYIRPSETEELKHKFSDELHDKLPFNFTFEMKGATRELLAIVHTKSEYLILELEETKADKKGNSFLTLYQELKYVMASINAAENIEDVCNRSIVELRKISGFDRIMIYQFDEDWNGIVIAETLDEDMEPYLGLRFPASDIPKQARELYKKNPYRLIPDREYTPVRLYPVINPMTNAFIDLSDCNLRSVPAVHIEYLRNMKVVASMSTRIMKDNKLWGLIACHHKTAKFLDYEMCSVFELLSGVISGKLTSLQNQEDHFFSSRLQTIQTGLVERIYANNNLVKGILDGDKTILDLLRLDGVAVAYKNDVTTMDNVPDKQEIKNLVMWLQSRDINKTFATSSLAEHYDNSAQYPEKASGMIVLPIHPEKGEYIIGFRSEVVQQVNWGGNPNEAINFEANRKNYHPRNSFSLWQETVKHTSVPWHKEEIAAAESLRNNIVEFTLKNLFSQHG